jgi:hypothetical protein
MRSAKWTCGAVILLITAFLITACFGPIYSEQKFGAMASKYGTMGKGATKSEVLTQLGAPDQVFKIDGAEAYVYRNAEGMSVIFGIYTKGSRKDLVVVFDPAGTVKDTATVDRGEGSTIIGLPNTLPFMLNMYDANLFDWPNYCHTSRYQVQKD